VLSIIIEYIVSGTQTKQANVEMLVWFVNTCNNEPDPKGICKISISELKQNGYLIHEVDTIMDTILKDVTLSN